jgi:hypothetical protein
MRVLECTKRLARFDDTAFFCPDGCFRPTRRSHSRSFSGAKGVPLIHPPLSLSPPLVDLWVPQVLQQLWDVNWLMGMQDRGGLIMALSTLFFFSACGAPEKKPASRTSPSEAPTTSTADASAGRRELNEHKEEPSLLRRMGSFRRRGTTASDAEMTGVRRQRYLSPHTHHGLAPPPCLLPECCRHLEQDYHSIRSTSPTTAL